MKGDRHCTFLLSSSDTIDDTVFEYCEEHNISEQESQKINVRSFMETRGFKKYNTEELVKKLEGRVDIEVVLIVERLTSPEKRSLLRGFSIFRPFSSLTNTESNKSEGKSEVVSVSNVLHRYLVLLNLCNP